MARRYFVRLTDVGFVLMDSIKEEIPGFDELFEANYMKSKNGDWYEIIDIRCDYFKSDSKSVYFTSGGKTFFLDPGDFGYIEIN